MTIIAAIRFLLARTIAGIEFMPMLKKSQMIRVNGPALPAAEQFHSLAA